MAINNKTLGTLALFTLVLLLSFAISFKLSLTNRALTPNAPESRPQAGSCIEQCPGNDDILRSCTPPEPGGGSVDSSCNEAGRIEPCGGKDFCCPVANGKWTNDMTACCVDTTWTPAENTVCTGTNLTQTSNCGKTKTVAGTKTEGCNTTCTDSTWTPDPALTCTTAKVTQTSNCGTKRDVDGTKTTGECVVACVDTTWTPDPALTCTTAKVTQTSNCGTTKSVDGTKDCCVDTTWTPSKTSTCSDKTLTQTSNCGTTRSVDGTKTCLPDLTVTTNTYQDDSRNKPGEYYIAKKISRVSRGQLLVYTMEVKNTGTGSAKNFKITDTLTGQNQSLVAFVDSEEKCSFDYPSKKLTCEIDNLDSKGVLSMKFRVRVAQTALNGKVIRNTVKAIYNNKTREVSSDVLVSSIVSCNEYCTNDSECLAGLACDVFSNKCRRPACANDTSCGCLTPTATVTKVITPKITVEPTDTLIDFPDSSMNTTTPTDVLAEEVLPEEVTQLPRTGIFDAPQTAVFGGGLLLAIIGLFFAL